MARSLIPPLVVVGLCLACAAAHSKQRTLAPEGTRVITAEQIEASGARTVWDALRRTVTTYTFRESGRIDHRGRSSIVLSEPPHVLLDGVVLGDVRVLDRMPASDVLTIEVLSGITGTTYHGTNGTNGVIRIRTRQGG